MTADGPAGAERDVGRKVYLAGPEVFLDDAAMVAVRDAKIQICAASGLVGVFPSEPDLADLVGASGPERATAFFDRLLAELDACDVGIANLTPFRGPSADVGTVWEVGYLIGRGRPVFGYTNVVGHYGARAVGLDGHAVEDFELSDNLMLDRSIRRSSGTDVVRTRVSAGHELTDLVGFAQCVRGARSGLRNVAETIAPNPVHNANTIEK